MGRVITRRKKKAAPRKARKKKREVKSDVPVFAPDGPVITPRK